MGEGSEEGRDCVHCEISKKNMARVERKGRGRTGGASRGRIDDEPSRGGGLIMQLLQYYDESIIKN